MAAIIGGKKKNDNGVAGAKKTNNTVASDSFLIVNNNKSRLKRPKNRWSSRNDKVSTIDKALISTFDTAN